MKRLRIPLPAVTAVKCVNAQRKTGTAVCATKKLGSKRVTVEKFKKAFSALLSLWPAAQIKPVQASQLSFKERNFIFLCTVPDAGSAYVGEAKFS